MDESEVVTEWSSFACFSSALMAETRIVLGFERVKFGFEVENRTTWGKPRWEIEE